MRRFVVMSLIAVATAAAQQYTRGIGVYPGDPNEYSGPVLKPGASEYRNLALRRPAYQSSAYDYNLTAQLVTDGIRDTRMPAWVATSTNRGELKKNEREWLIDGNWVSTVDLPGQSGWVQVFFGGADAAPQIDRIDVDGRVFTRGQQPENWTCTVKGSDDAQSWKELGQASNMARPGGEVRPSIHLSAPSRFRYYRIEFEDPRAASFQVGELNFFNKSQRVPAGGPFLFTSAWMPAGKGEEWVAVDLGGPSTFDRVALHWIRAAAAGSIQTSDDGKSWRTVQDLPAAAPGPVSEIKLAQPVNGRWVRVLMAKPATPDGYVLSELQVFGRGGVMAEAQPPRTPAPDGRLDLSRGAWRLQRDSQVRAAGDVLSRIGFDDSHWLTATVPGTVLTSFHNAGAIPDPNYGDNQLAISDSFFHADFWYRNEFSAPVAAAGRKVWLNLDGVNWKADVFMNGIKLGRIEGGFIRGRFDVTQLLRAGKNVLAVRVEKNAHPGSVKEKTYENPDKNGGVLGADNPTYHAAIGWDWIPTMRGRDTGIWNDVYLTTTGTVTLEDPFVMADLPLPDTSSADLTVEVTLRNHAASPARGTLRGRIGEVKFESPVTLPASGVQTVKLSPATHPALKLSNPKLWWPNGYGDPHLYDVDLSFVASGGQVSGTKSFKTGIREFAYSEEGGALRMWVNGRRFVGRGGNWGFGESMLRYRAREYDTAIRYHRDSNFTMIRNWVGQIGDDELYEAGDRHGIVIMNDFWLANPWDGPDPDDNAMFMRNVVDTVKRIRNHPSLIFYCGRNEGYPPAPLDRAIRKALAELHPGLHYVSSSADDVISGHGPYRMQPIKLYFRERATPKFHSEMGMPNIVTHESFKRFMPDAEAWPQGRMWGLHDYTLTGAQGGASFNERIEKSYGGARNAAEWVELAQFVNYEGHRAMFEAQSKNRMGLLIWMSHPTWPSFVWQTYDYYFDTSAGYYGAKKASEPLHIQWNALTENVEVVNYHAGNATGVTAQAQLFNMDGKQVWEKSASLDSKEDSTESPFKMEYPQTGLTAVHFIRLQLKQGDRLISDNFYWRGIEESGFRALRQIPAATVEAKTTAEQNGPVWRLTTQLTNNSQHPALMVRLKAVQSKSGEQILPALFSDNYVALMPGETKTIMTELRQADTQGDNPVVAVQGFNLAK